MLTTQMPRALGLLVYREYQDGATIDELSEALHIPAQWIEERIEAVRLCLEKQIRIELRPLPHARIRTSAKINSGSRKRRRSR